MTGFGAGEADGPKGRFRAELRGINSRFLEVRVRVPQMLAPFEADLRRRIGETFSRGRLDLSMTWEPAGESEAPVRLNPAAAKAYLQAGIQLRSALGLHGEIGLVELLALPGVVETVRPESADPELRELALQALDGAVRAADGMRRAEGAATVADILARIERLCALRAKVAARSADVPAAAQRRLQERLARLGLDAQVDPGRLAQEVAYLADRSDIAEELARLEAHFQRCRETLARDAEAVGKTLEFLSQELHRETNTIGSKSGDLEISGWVLEMKAEIERVREQVLNLE
jgi:uncharacterized protein (TIGR00255 family)